MNKYLLLSILLCGLFGSTMAQKDSSDLFRTNLNKTSNLVERFDLIRNHLEGINLGIIENVDYNLCVELVRIAQELKSDSLLAISYNWIGSFFSFTRGDNVTALEFYYKGIPLAEKANDKRRLSSLYFDMAIVYKDLKNYPGMLESTLKGGQNLPDSSSKLYAFMLTQYQRSFCEYHLSINKPDSALYYANLATGTAAKVGSVNFNFSTLFLRAASFAAMKDVEMADSLFAKADSLKSKVKLNSLLNIFYTRYIGYLLNESRISKAKIYSHQFLDLGFQANSYNMKLRATGFLRQVYDSLHNTDSAYYYSKLEADINAQIFSQDNMNKLRDITMRDQLRGIEEEARQAAYRNRVRQLSFIAGIAALLIVAVLLWRINRNRHLTNKKLQQQNAEIQEQKRKVEQTLAQLKATQSKLIHAEKMASLGELTAGIAHEIQNPLNFVNNFSEVSCELADELKMELVKGDTEEVKLLLESIQQNLVKINQHGKRADGIVKGMLQHSRTGAAQTELTDINALCEESMRLAFHGLRAKDKNFDATIKTEFDKNIDKVNVVPQDIASVLLNLLNNAFYAVKSAKQVKGEDYIPTVTIKTKYNTDITITIIDNGVGIPQDIIGKIFQPFFTTKPTGQGTGLGLSLAYDIIKAHGGEIKVESEPGVETRFVVLLPGKDDR